MIFGRPGRAAKPLSPHRKLQLVAAQLNQLVPGWKVAGDEVHGPFTAVVRFGREHFDDPRHVDLDLVLDPGDPERTTIADCFSAPGETIEEAVTQGIRMWAETTGATALELMTQESRFANHYDDGEPGAFPGWHMIGGGIAGWGAGPDVGAVQRWIAEAKPWIALAPAMDGALDRDRINGVKLFIAGSAHNAITEVRINGQVHELASRALLELDWPRVPEGSVARTFFLLI